MRLYQARCAGVLLPLLLGLVTPLLSGCDGGSTGTLVTPKEEDPAAIRASDEAAQAEAKALRTKAGRR